METPLQKSAIIATRCSGVGAWPSNSGRSTRNQIAAGPGARNCPCTTRSVKPADERVRILVRGVRGLPRVGSGQRHFLFDGRRRQLELGATDLEHGRSHDDDVFVEQRHRTQLNLASFAQHFGADLQRCDRYRPQQIDRDAHDLHRLARHQALSRPRDQRGRRSAVLQIVAPGAGGVFGGGRSVLVDAVQAIHC